MILLVAPNYRGIQHNSAHSFSVKPSSRKPASQLNEELDIPTPRNFWTTVEVDLLLLLVREYGSSNWAGMAVAWREVHKGNTHGGRYYTVSARDHKALKSKYQNWSKQETVANAAVTRASSARGSFSWAPSEYGRRENNLIFEYLALRS